MGQLEFFTVVGRLSEALILSALVGLEREFFHKAAGLRTHILVGVGSALMMLISLRVADSGIGTVADPGRVAAGVVTGIGFLGAGTIFRASEGIHGLTTAATIWMTAGIGLACGLGFHSGAITATVLSLLTLTIIVHLDRFLPNPKSGRPKRSRRKR